MPNDILIYGWFQQFLLLLAKYDELD